MCSINNCFVLCHQCRRGCCIASFPGLHAQLLQATKSWVWRPGNKARCCMQVLLKKNPLWMMGVYLYIRAHLCLSRSVPIRFQGCAARNLRTVLYRSLSSWPTNVFIHLLRVQTMGCTQKYAWGYRSYYYVALNYVDFLCSNSVVVIDFRRNILNYS